MFRNDDKEENKLRETKPYFDTNFGGKRAKPAITTPKPVSKPAKPVSKPVSTTKPSLTNVVEKQNNPSANVKDDLSNVANQDPKLTVDDSKEDRT